ncbi:uncharacterized protein LACBIDRAFT_330196 [Laccaria bicolor S238N-H82]|uniref:Predicted protein n=1 Tax=Laccaria bicolor (strain S238N-H82 / ATCC MYA-4686) TaxID=486041 RepID=B0DKL6_LACBS|nr:uncharacterized protein LACBIDRAFT_330196 [Laccaria bicolor S238N-H82]EDR04967.1 predicted protein [Laccaria bicolor S238N-H82]|eukprot:XP_001884357.1 predicted protein [Laccaria bicolor S238N-H82]
MTETELHLLETWVKYGFGSILAHGKTGCGTVGMNTVSCKGVDPWGGLYEHSHFGNPMRNSRTMGLGPVILPFGLGGPLCILGTAYSYYQFRVIYGPDELSVLSEAFCKLSSLTKCSTYAIHTHDLRSLMQLFEDESRVIICGQKGCKTLWYHFSRVGLPVDLGINDWVCDPYFTYIWKVVPMPGCALHNALQREFFEIVFGCV